MASRLPVHPMEFHEVSEENARDSPMLMVS